MTALIVIGLVFVAVVAVNVCLPPAPDIDAGLALAKGLHAIEMERQENEAREPKRLTDGAT